MKGKRTRYTGTGGIMKWLYWDREGKMTLYTGMEDKWTGFYWDRGNNNNWSCWHRMTGADAAATGYKTRGNIVAASAA